MPLKTGIAGGNRTKLYYEMMGESHALVLIHSGLLDCRMWDGQFTKFAKHYKVIRYDIRGFGKSALSKGKYSHVKDLKSLLKFLEVDNLHIIGISLGGMIAIDFAIEYPEKVSSLILTSTIPFGFQNKDDELTKMTLAIYKTAHQNNVEQAVEMWLCHPVFATIRTRTKQKIKQMLIDNSKAWTLPTDHVIWSTPPAIERLSKIKASTLIIVGDKDVPDVLDAANVLEDNIGVAIKMVIPNAGHHINLEKPRQFNNIVLDFLSYL